MHSINLISVVSWLMISGFLTSTAFPALPKAPKSTPKLDKLRTKVLSAASDAETEMSKEKFSEADKEFVRWHINRRSRPLLDISDPTRLKVGDMGVPQGPVSVNTIISESEAIVHDNRLWVKGVKTSGLTTDAKVTLPDKCYIIDGTEKYTTVLGTQRVIFRLVPYDSTKPEKFIQSEVVKAWDKAEVEYVNEKQRVAEAARKKKR